MMKRLLACLLVGTMVLTPLAVMAAEQTEEATEVLEEAAQETEEAAEEGEEEVWIDLENTPVEEWPPFLQDMFFPQAPEVEEGKIHVACIGDSITWGAGVLVPDMDRANTYPVLLGGELGDEYQVLNYGMSGKTLLKEGDDPYVEQDFYALSHDAAADIYVIVLGTNDSKPYNWNAENFKSQLTDFVKSYQDLENAPKIFLMTPPAAFVVDGAEEVVYDIQADTIETEAAPIVREVAQELGTSLIDMYEETKDHPEWFPDGVHPGAEGNAAFAGIVKEALLAEE
ncbi:MAG: hypothetical protein IIZ39_14480 [Blautia sp.]|nr:hypothetical protein [Blautia sp.]